jgi:hypothetical protein
VPLRKTFVVVLGGAVISRKTSGIPNDTAACLARTGARLELRGNHIALQIAVLQDAEPENYWRISTCILDYLEVDQWFSRLGTTLAAVDLHHVLDSVHQRLHRLPHSGHVLRGNNTFPLLFKHSQ